MGRSRATVTSVIAVRFLGAEREIEVLKEEAGNFYVFPPAAKRPLGDVDWHMSWHASGERHHAARVRNAGKWEKTPGIRRDTKMVVQKPVEIAGAELLLKSGVFSAAMFLHLPTVGTNDGELVILDADRAGFVNDAFFWRVYLVCPGAEGQIPPGPGAGPQILHVLRSTRPWMAVQVFQQARGR